MTFRRMLPFLFLNIVVSATVVVGILYWWEYGRESEELPGDPFVSVVVTETPTVVPFIEDTPIPPPAEEEDDATVYIVNSGDTLGTISELFEVSIDDIMAANGLSNPNLLSVGQELIIPINGIPTAEPTAAPTETPDVAPSPIPTEPLDQGEVIIEIREIIAAGVLTEEAVSIVNVGSRPVALQDWTLSDQDGHVYTFGQNTLFGDGAGIVVNTEAGQSSNLELYWGLEEPIWELGDTATLLDAEGTVQATFVVQGADPNG
ncbi:MAG: lamin tail domain-containing protein [Anaerolineales bacterium]|nr:lamin tail domain-containing protein [Anaerolineales bacterium]